MARETRTHVPRDAFCVFSLCAYSDRTVNIAMWYAPIVGLERQNVRVACVATSGVAVPIVA